MPDRQPPSYPIEGVPFNAKPPKDHGRLNEPWGEKTFDRETIPDRRVRDALTWLQDMRNAIVRAQVQEQMPPDELARRADISTTNLQAFLRGDHPPSWQTFAAVLSVLDLRLEIDDPFPENRPTIEEEPGRTPWLPGRRRRREAD